MSMLKKKLLFPRGLRTIIDGNNIFLIKAIHRIETAPNFVGMSK